MGKRQAAVEQTRARILAAARAVLTGSDRYTEFSVPGVARAADVARVTVYNQFGSKAGLLEALSDDLARAGGLTELTTVFDEPDPRMAVSRFITAFIRFWESDRLLIRRLRALAALDPELEKAIAGRDERRRRGARAVVRRLTSSVRPGGLDPESAVDVLTTLTSFETYDALAGDHRRGDEVAALVERLARAVLDLADPPNTRSPHTRRR